MMTIIESTREVQAQRRTQSNAEHAVDDRDVLEHLRRIRQEFFPCQPWGWIKTDIYGKARGSNRRKLGAVHEAGHCVSAFVLGNYSTEARVNKSRSAKRLGFFNCRASIHSYSVEEFNRTIEAAGFTQEQALLAASFEVIKLNAGFAAAMHVGGWPDDGNCGVIDDWQAENLLAVFPGLDERNLQGMAAGLVDYYVDAVKAVALELYENPQLETKELLSAAVGGFGPEFPIHPRTRWSLKEGPYGCGLT